LGIAYDNYTLVLVQNFENNYITFDKPVTSDYKSFEFSGIASSGTLVDVRIRYDPMPNSTAYDQHKGQPYYDSGTFVADVVPPAPPLPTPVQQNLTVSSETNETTATASNATETSQPVAATNTTASSSNQNATDTQTNSTSNPPSNANTSSNGTSSSANDTSTTQIASLSGDNNYLIPLQPVPESQTITASKWEVNGTSMDVAFDMTPVLTQAGVYTIYVVLQDDNGNKFNATSYSVYYNGS
jgi:hypothetical protein